MQFFLVSLVVGFWPSVLYKSVPVETKAGQPFGREAEEICHLEVGQWVLVAGWIIWLGLYIIRIIHSERKSTDILQHDG